MITLLSVYVQLSCMLIQNGGAQFPIFGGPPGFPPALPAGLPAPLPPFPPQQPNVYVYQQEPRHRYRSSSESSESDDSSRECSCEQSCNECPNTMRYTYCCRAFCQTCPNPYQTNNGGVVIVPYPYPLVVTGLQPKKKESPEKEDKSMTKLRNEIKTQPKSLTETFSQFKDAGNSSNSILALIAPPTSTTTTTTSTTTTTTTTTTTPTTTTVTTTTTKKTKNNESRTKKSKGHVVTRRPKNKSKPKPKPKPKPKVKSKAKPKPVNHDRNVKHVMLKAKPKLRPRPTLGASVKEYVIVNKDKTLLDATKLESILENPRRFSSRKGPDKNDFNDIIVQVPAKTNSKYVLTSLNNLKQSWMPKYGIVPIPDSVASNLMTRLRSMKVMQNRKSPKFEDTSKPSALDIVEKLYRY